MCTVFYISLLWFFWNNTDTIVIKLRPIVGPITTGMGYKHSIIIIIIITRSFVRCSLLLVLLFVVIYFLTRKIENKKKTFVKRILSHLAQIEQKNRYIHTKKIDREENYIRI